MLLCFSFAIIGCGKKASEKMAEKMIESAAEKDGVKADVSISDNTVTMRTKDGTAVYAGGENVKIPDNFPKDVYIYEGAKVISAVSVPNGFSLMLQTKDAADKVASKLKDKIVSQGWTEEMTMTQSGMIMLGYKKENRSAIINITPDKDITQIAITVASDKE